MRRVAGVVCALALAACSASVAEAPIEQWQSLDIAVTPVEAPSPQVGRLTYRGGLQLALRERREGEAFGGLSGLEVLEDGRFLAVSDFGAWVEGHLELDAEGNLVGVTGLRQAQMRDENGDVFPNKEAADAEDLAQLPDGRFAVSFEQTQSIRVYDLNRDGPFGAARRGPVLEGASALPSNTGLEALTATANGALLVGAEGGADADTPLWLARLDAATPAPVVARYVLPRAYSLTSLDRAPDGDFIALERFYAPIIGPRARITRVTTAMIESGRVEPEELARLDPPFPLDNFEGISAVRAPGGGLRIYVISDDNLSERQRTLLLAFDVADGPTTPSP